MSMFVTTLRHADDLLVRASSLLQAGSTKPAGHLVARSGRQVAAILDTPLTAGMPNRGGRMILANALERMQSAHASIGKSAIGDALESIRSARFGIDIQLPYGPL